MGCCASQIRSVPASAVSGMLCKALPASCPKNISSNMCASSEGEIMEPEPWNVRLPCDPLPGPCKLDEGDSRRRNVEPRSMRMERICSRDCVLSTDPGSNCSASKSR
mmetsp:Transcript_48812/g.128951  ORF Transcript_48812/g.128951 Transcript_48812/m.128951 type:complete len:107 (-) Transcript_48812:131-451(-)